ncbi:hypothetical protein D3C74_435640 [compost metagenome]
MSSNVPIVDQRHSSLEQIINFLSKGSVRTVRVDETTISRNGLVRHSGQPSAVPCLVHLRVVSKIESFNRTEHLTFGRLHTLIAQSYLELTKRN